MTSSGAPFSAASRVTALSQCDPCAAASKSVRMASPAVVKFWQAPFWLDADAGGGDGGRGLAVPSGPGVSGPAPAASRTESRLVVDAVPVRPDGVPTAIPGGSSAEVVDGDAGMTLQFTEVCSDPRVAVTS